MNFKFLSWLKIFVVQGPSTDPQMYTQVNPQGNRMVIEQSFLLAVDCLETVGASLSVDSIFHH